MGGWSGFWRVISKFFSTPTTVFVVVFVLLCFFLVIYYLVGACKGFVIGYFDLCKESSSLLTQYKSKNASCTSVLE